MYINIKGDTKRSVPTHFVTYLMCYSATLTTTRSCSTRYQVPVLYMYVRTAYDLGYVLLIGGLVGGVRTYDVGYVLLIGGLGGGRVAEKIQEKRAC